MNSEDYIGYAGIVTSDGYKQYQHPQNILVSARVDKCNKKEIAMNEIFNEIIKLSNIETDNEALKEIKEIAEHALFLSKWENEYGIKLKYKDLMHSRYLKLSDYAYFIYFKNGYEAKKTGGAEISWSDDRRQPIDEWVYVISFPEGPFIFGEDYDYQKPLFIEFFNELKNYSPDYLDTNNHKLYWNVKNAKNIFNDFNEIFKKYKEKNRSELKEREIKKLEVKLLKLKQNNGSF